MLSGCEYWYSGASGRTIFVGSQGASSGRTGNITISSTVSGSGATQDGATTTIFKDGVGALTLSGNNDYTGRTLFNEGTIFIGHNSAFGTGTLQIHFGNFSATKVLASSNATDRTLSNDMNIYGSNLTLGAAGYTGGITVNGAISLGNDTSGSNDRTITVVSGTSHSFGGVVSGNTSNKLIKAGAGSLTLANNNTFNAGVQLNEGILLVGHNNALGTGPMQVQFDIAGTKTLASSSSAAYTLNNNINIYNDLTLGQTSGGTGSLTLGGTIQLGNEANQNRAITVNGSHTISGSIQGARGIVKQGGGTLQLSGANTSTGQIYIDDGIIDLNGGSLGNGTIEIGAGTGGAASAILPVTSSVFPLATSNSLLFTATVPE